MILGRPTNLWLGLLTAIQGAIAITAIQMGLDPQAVATISGAWSAVFGAIILVVANQPPSLRPGDAYTVITEPSSPNLSKIANTNMAATPPESGK